MWPNCGLAVTSVFKVRKAVWEKKTKLETEWGRKTDECEWGGGSRRRQYFNACCHHVMSSRRQNAEAEKSEKTFIKSPHRLQHISGIFHQQNV